MALSIAFGDYSTGTGTLTLTSFEVGDTATPVGKPLRVVQSTVEMRSKDVEKYVNSEMVFTLNEGTTLRG